MIFLSVVLGMVALVGLIIFMGHSAFSVTPRPNTSTPAELGLSYRDIYFRNPNDETLHGWWIPSADAPEDAPAPTLVFIPGWRRNCQRMLPYVDACKSLPVNMLVIEPRGHGENPKNNFITEVGIAEDINGAIDWLVLRPEVDLEKIGIVGHSFGAAATIYETSRDKRITAFVADAGFANHLEIIKRYFQDYNIPYFPFGWLIRHYIQMRIGKTFHAIAPENAIRSIDAPGLLIHGDQDTTVPVEDSDRILKNARENIQLWIAEGYDHSNTTDHPDFGRILRNFLNNALINRPVNFYRSQSPASFIPDLN
ncbi:MAG: hypothetical protein MAGBODY4_00124 [Candidatus Marinimicrobia bacterium]|nr:hypothetical protein [Candidatus Neomarinimicrobiota bacterium]